MKVPAGIWRTILPIAASVACQGGATTAIDPTDEPPDDTATAVAPFDSGRLVAFVSVTASDTYELWIADASSGERRSVTGPLPEGSYVGRFGWSPPTTAGVRRLAYTLYSADPDGTGVYVTLDDASGATRVSGPVVDDELELFDSVWSADGAHVAYEGMQNGDDERQLYLAPVDGSGPVRVSHCTSGRPDFATWAPVGDWFAYGCPEDVDRAIDIYAVRAGGQDHTRVTQAGPDDDWLGPRWAPDGNALAVSLRREGRVRPYVYGMAEGTTLLRPEDLGYDSGHTIRELMWSPTGSHLAVLDEALGGLEGRTLRTVDVATGEIHPVSNPGSDPTPGLLRVDFAPDGGHIVYHSDEGGTPNEHRLFAATPTGAQHAALVPASAPLGSGPAHELRDDKVLYTARFDVEGPHEFVVVGYDGGEPVRVGLEGAPLQRVDARFSPSGQTLAVLARRDGEVALHLAGPMGEDVVERAVLDADQLAWTLDGSRIVVWADDGMVAVDPSTTDPPLRLSPVGAEIEAFIVEGKF